MASNNPDCVSDKLKFEALSIEYQKLCEDVRSMERALLPTLTLFFTLSFGILAYTIGKELTAGDLYAAALSSIFSYLVCIISLERLCWRMELRFIRLGEIEQKFLEITGTESPCYHGNRKQYTIRKKIQDNHYYKYKYINPYCFIVVISRNLRARHIRFMIIGALLILWIFRIVD